MIHSLIFFGNIFNPFFMSLPPDSLCVFPDQKPSAAVLLYHNRPNHLAVVRASCVIHLKKLKSLFHVLKWHKPELLKRVYLQFFMNVK